MTTFTANYEYSGGNPDTASLRRLIKDYRNLLTGCGLVKVPVMGEIDVETVTYPASSNTSAGFDIFRFNDALQATAPIYLKIEYGRAASGGSFGLWATLGTTVSAEGVLSGALSDRRGMSSYLESAATGVSYSCHTDGFFGVINRPGGAASTNYAGSGSFAVCRSCDANGYPTGRGAYIIWNGTQNPVAQSIRFEGAQGPVSAASNAVFQLPLGVAASVGGDVPFYPIWMPLPDLIPVFGLVAYPDALVAVVDFADVAMVGSRVRRYIVGPQFLVGRNAANPAFGMLWE